MAPTPRCVAVRSRSVRAPPLLAARDFFTVANAAFRVLYVFFVIQHTRRTVLHVRVTEHPTAAWIIQKLREAFAYDAIPRHRSFNNDKKYGTDVLP